MSLNHVGPSVLVLLSCSVCWSLPSDTTFHYEPVPGKIVGVWPDAWSADRLTQLKQKNGFSGVVIVPDQVQYTNALAAGFSPTNMLIVTWDDTYINAVDNFPAGIYYTDEAAEHDCSGHPTGYRLYTPQEISTRTNYVHSHRPGSLFVIGGYKRCSHNQLAGANADLMMYTAYRNWDQIGLPVCHVNMGWGNDWENPWLPGDFDQRNSWTAMRQMFGTKFSNTWVHGGGDEYANLFVHANVLGLTGIWQYNGAPIDSTLLESFCYAAWQNGWLQRVTDPPLPIQLVSFTARAIPPQRVLLHWQTLSEVNNYGFDVQRRSDTIQFATIPGSFIPGHGTTTEPHEYSYIDSMAMPLRSWYRLKQYDLDGTVHYGPEVEIELPTGIPNTHLFAFRLLQNYPNPFNPSTIIRFAIPVGPFNYTSLRIYDVLGREMETLVNEIKGPGAYTVTWNAENIAGGVYFYRLQAGEFVETKKLLLLK